MRQVNPPDLEALRPHTALYMVYHSHLRKTLWKLSQAGRIGAVKTPAVEAVPPPCAELFLRHLEWGYQVERAEQDEDDEGRSSTFESIFLGKPSALRDITKAGGDLRIVAGVNVENKLVKGFEGMSSLHFVFTVWSVTGAEASV